MLIPRGRVLHENLNTAFTHIDHLIERLRKNQFTGYCLISFWEYDGVLFFQKGALVNGYEEQGMRDAQTRTGQAAVTSILEKAHEKDGEISIHQLSQKAINALADAMQATPKYQGLSTDLTSLDKVIALLQKDQLSGYIEVILGNEAGIANLYFVRGTMLDILFAPPDNQMIGETSPLHKIAGLCETHGAEFNVYQVGEHADTQPRDISGEKKIPVKALKLFEAIFKNLETVTDTAEKPGTFQSHFKKVVSQVADTYTFLDPFIGDFRYANHTLSYQGDTTYGEFVDGLCAVISSTLSAIFTVIPEETLMPRLSKAFESVITTYPHLIDQLNLEGRMPEVFRDYTFFQAQSSGQEASSKGAEARKVLNLQGIGVADLGTDSILREFYRVITDIADKYVNADGQIGYALLKKSHEFQQYQTATAFLQQFNPASLHERHEQIAFWLNLYNFLLIDGILEFHIRSTIHDEKDVFTKTSYRLGEYLFSLDDIEHGILRNNQRRPYAHFRQFGNTDPRKQFIVRPPDIRAHCCFAYGATSSPPLTVYAPEDLDRQLDQAVVRYLLTNGMRFDQEQREIWLSRSFYWYRKDFESDNRTLLDFVISALKDHEIGSFLSIHRDDVIIRFLDYDWSLNGK